MAFVPNFQDWEEPVRESGPSITVYPLAENKRPVGFGPWPADPKPKKKRKAKKK